MSAGLRPESHLEHEVTAFAPAWKVCSHQVRGPPDVSQVHLIQHCISFSTASPGCPHKSQALKKKKSMRFDQPGQALHVPEQLWPQHCTAEVCYDVQGSLIYWTPWICLLGADATPAIGDVARGMEHGGWVCITLTSWCKVQRSNIGMFMLLHRL